MQVLYGIKDLFSTSYLADPQLSRVLPSNLLEWYRSPEGQWFRVVVSQEMKLPADANPTQLERVFKDFAPAVDRVKHATTYLVSRHSRILFASATPSAPTYANPPGLIGWLEIHRLIYAGEPPAQICKSATLPKQQRLT